MIGMPFAAHGTRMYYDLQGDAAVKLLPGADELPRARSSRSGGGGVHVSGPLASQQLAEVARCTPSTEGAQLGFWL
jgi:hypothetical protein